MQSDGTSEPIELTFVGHVNTMLTGAWWDGLLAEFSRRHPGITVRQLPGGVDFQPHVMGLLEAGVIPDVTYAFAATPQTVRYLLEWDRSDPDLAVIRDLDPQLVGGRLYSLGTDVNVRNTIYVNRELLGRAGIDAFPTTWDGLEAACHRLNAAGILPMLVAGEWVTGRVFMGLNDIYVRTPDWNRRRAAGEVHFSDAEWLEAARRWQRWSAAGFFNPDVLDAGYFAIECAFLDGRGALYPMGSWFPGTEKASPATFRVGVVAPPSHDGVPRLNGGIGTISFQAFRATRHEAAARILAKWLALDPWAHDALFGRDSGFSILDLGPDVPARDLTPLEAETQRLIADSIVTIDYMGQADLAPAWLGYADAVNAIAQNLLRGNDAATELALLDDLWDRGTEGACRRDRGWSGPLVSVSERETERSPRVAQPIDFAQRRS